MSLRTKTTKSRTKAAANPGQPESVETARRISMMDRVNKGEIDNAGAAKELGMHPGAWALWKARQSKGKKGGAKQKAPKRAAKSKAPKRAARKVAGSTKTMPGKRGRKADPTETARRVAVLKRVNAGELSNAQAAKELGLKGGTWAVWKSNYGKRTGKGKAPARRGRPPGASKRAAQPAKGAARSARIDLLGGLVAQLESLQRFQEGLRQRLRELADFVEANAPE